MHSLWALLVYPFSYFILKLIKHCIFKQLSLFPFTWPARIKFVTRRNSRLLILKDSGGNEDISKKMANRKRTSTTNSHGQNQLILSLISASLGLGTFCNSFLTITCDTHCCHFSQQLKQAKYLTVRIFYMSTSLTSQSENFPVFESAHAKQFKQQQVSCKAILFSVISSL